MVGETGGDYKEPGQREMHLGVQQFYAFHQHMFKMLILSCVLILSLFFAYILLCPIQKKSCQYDWFMRTTALTVFDQTKIIPSCLIYLIVVQINTLLYTMYLYTAAGFNIKRKYFEQGSYYERGRKEFINYFNIFYTLFYFLFFVSQIFILILFYEYINCTFLRKNNGNKAVKNINSMDRKFLGQYAIKLGKVPLSATEEDIREMVKTQQGKLSSAKKWQTLNLKIQQIIRIFNIDEFKKIESQNLKNFKKAIKQGTYLHFKPQELLRKQPDQLNYCETSFIVFKRRQSAQLFLSTPSIKDQILSLICYPHNGISSHKVKDSYVQMSQVYEPNDIVWENCTVGSKSRIIRKTVFDFVAIVLIALGGYMQIKFKIISIETENDSDGTIISLLSGIAVSIYTQLLYFYLIITTKLERPHSQTEQNRILLLILSFYGFINSGLFPIACDIFSDLHNFQLNQNLCIKIVSLVISNQIINVASFFFVDYLDLIGFAKRYYIRNYGDRFKFFILTQIQANQWFQNLQLDFAYRYSYVISTVWIMLFYSILVPIVFFISYFGLLFNFIIVYNLVKKNRIKRPKVVSSVLFDTACILLTRNLFFIALGSICLVAATLYTGIVKQIPTDVLILLIIINLFGVLCWFITKQMFVKFYHNLSQGCSKCFKKIFDSQQEEQLKEEEKNVFEDVQNGLKLLTQHKQVMKNYRIETSKQLLASKEENLYCLSKKGEQYYEKANRAKYFDSEQNKQIQEIYENLQSKPKYKSKSQFMMTYYEMNDKLKEYQANKIKVQNMETQIKDTLNRIMKNLGQDYHDAATQYYGPSYKQNPFTNYRAQQLQLKSIHT